ADVKLFRDTSSPFGTLDGGDTQVGSTQTTTGTGAFSFTGLAADTYFVTETNPSGFGSTAAIAGTNGASVVTSDQIKVVLAAGASSTGNEFLDQQQNASISGKVVNDANGNGVDNSEAGLAGADVKLFR